MEEFLVLWVLAMITGFGVWSLRSLGKHWERKHQRQMGQLPGEQFGDRVTVLERQVQEFGGMLENRVAEIEERQDFAERLLTQAAREELPGERH